MIVDERCVCPWTKSQEQRFARKPQLTAILCTRIITALLVLHRPPLITLWAARTTWHRTHRAAGHWAGHHFRHHRTGHHPLILKRGGHDRIVGPHQRAIELLLRRSAGKARMNITRRPRRVIDVAHLLHAIRRGAACVVIDKTISSFEHTVSSSQPRSHRAKKFQEVMCGAKNSCS